VERLDCDWRSHSPELPRLLTYKWLKSKTCSMFLWTDPQAEFASRLVASLPRDTLSTHIAGTLDHTRHARVINMISPLVCATISAARKAVHMRKTLRRRNMNTSWSLSLHSHRPTSTSEISKIARLVFDRGRNLHVPRTSESNHLSIHMWLGSSNSSSVHSCVPRWIMSFLLVAFIAAVPAAAAAAAVQ